MNSNRCLNCGISLINHRICRSRVENIDPQLHEILDVWIEHASSPTDLVCQACITILSRQRASGNVSREFGHEMVCLGCGSSVLRNKKFQFKSNAERNEVMSWNPPISVHHLNSICRACYMRIQRNVLIDSNRDHAPSSSQYLTQQGVHQDEDRPVPVVSCSETPEESMPHSSLELPFVRDIEPSPPIVEVQDNIIDNPVIVPAERDVAAPPPPPLPELAILNVVNVPQPQEATMTLRSYKRVAATSRHCIFSGCRNSSRLLVPIAIKQRVLIDFDLYIPRIARICPFHLENYDWTELSEQRTYNTFNKIQIEDMLYLLSEAAKVTFDFENIENINSHILHYWLGVSLVQFYEIYNSSMTLQTVKHPKTALCIYLMKLRTGDSNERLSTLFNMPISTLRSKMTEVRSCLEQDYLPLHLGLGHITIQDVAERNLLIPNGLFGDINRPLENRPAIVICDGTYIYMQKSSNYKFQKDSYSLHKYRNLAKPFLFTGTDGHIIEVCGPYRATESDAFIMHNLFRDPNSPLRQFFRPGDIFIVDRGFRDVVPELESYGYKVYMPETISEGQYQLTTLQANKTRCVTLVRWVVEVVNGRFKRDFKLLRQNYFNRASPQLMLDFSIAAALINHFHPVIEDRPDAHDILSRALQNLNIPNVLADYVDAHNLNRHRSDFTNINAELPQLNNFPQLTASELILVSLGTYQIKQSRSYYGEHIRDNGIFQIEVSNNLENINNENLTGILLRGRIQSRHTSRKTYFVYVLYIDDENVTALEGIKGYSCNCKSGRRTVGCCSHVMTVIWFLGWARHQPDQIQPPAKDLDDLFINESDYDSDS